VSDDLEPITDLEPIAIDDRSLGERMIAGSRTGYARMREIAQRQRFDAIALLWMVCVLIIVGSEIYSTLRRGSLGGAFGGLADDWWYKVELLAEISGGWAFVTLLGVGLAALVTGARARLALWIATAIGVCAFAGSIAGVAVSWHDFGGPLDNARPPIDDRLVGTVRYLGYAGLALLVVLIAWGLLSTYRRPAEIA
jgi:hypothetical protein